MVVLGLKALLRMFLQACRVFETVTFGIVVFSIQAMIYLLLNFEIVFSTKSFIKMHIKHTVRS